MYTEWIMRRKKVRNVDKLFEILETEYQIVSKIIWQKKEGCQKSKTNTLKLTNV